MKKGLISIVGPIGSSLDEDGNMRPGVELVDVVSKVTALGPDLKELTIAIHSPGGYLHVAEEISDYLNSLKPNVHITTTSYPDDMGRSLIGSAATVIYLAGDTREVDINNDDLFIHMPQLDPGRSDSKRLIDAAISVAQKEEQLLALYINKTGASKEALTPLMRNETVIRGQQIVDLGFANKVKESVIPIQAKVNMSKQEKSLLERIKDLLKGVEATASYEVKLAGGKSLTTSAADEAGLIGASAMIDGQPAPDGEHPAEDGRVVVVKGGKIEMVKPKPTEEATGMQAVLNQLKEQSSAFENFKKEVNASIEEIAKHQGLTSADLNLIKAEFKTGKKPDTTPAKGNKKEDAEEWKKLHKANMIGELKKTDPEKYKRLFFAMYGKYPNM